MDAMYIVVFLCGAFSTVYGQCYLSYHHCSGYDWCCPDGYVCTGTSTCLSIGSIVGICIGCLVGLIILGAIIKACCCSARNSSAAGTVVTTQPGDTGLAYVGQQQYGQQQFNPGFRYGQPTGFSQPTQNNPAYSPQSNEYIKQ